MEAIFLDDETYKNLLELKNFISIKVRQITNQEILDNLKQGISIYEQFNPREFDYEPEYTIGECISQIVGVIWHEQETGEVAYIT